MPEKIFSRPDLGKYRRRKGCCFYLPQFFKIFNVFSSINFCIATFPMGEIPPHPLLGGHPPPNGSPRCRILYDVIITASSQSFQPKRITKKNILPDFSEHFRKFRVFNLNEHKRRMFFFRVVRVNDNFWIVVTLE